MMSRARSTAVVHGGLVQVLVIQGGEKWDNALACCVDYFLSGETTSRSVML